MIKTLVKTVQNTLRFFHMQVFEGLKSKMHRKIFFSSLSNLPKNYLVLSAAFNLQEGVKVPSLDNLFNAALLSYIRNPEKTSFGFYKLHTSD